MAKESRMKEQKLFDNKLVSKLASLDLVSFSKQLISIESMRTKEGSLSDEAKHQRYLRKRQLNDISLTKSSELRWIFLKLRVCCLRRMIISSNCLFSECS